MRSRFTLFSLLAALLAMSAEKAAAQQVATAMTRSPEQASELTRRALIFLEQGEDASDEAAKMAAYQEGEKLARQALELDDGNADAHFALFATEGRRLVLEGSVNPISLMKVNSRLDRVLELNPHHSDALAARGGMYRQLPMLLGGSLDKAERDLRRSIELDPQATGARIELAKTYHEMGREDQVRPLIQEALHWAEILNKPRRVREARAFLAEIESD